MVGPPFAELSMAMEVKVLMPDNSTACSINNSGPTSSFTVLFARVAWFMLGLAALVVLTVKALIDGTNLYKRTDVLFPAVLILMIGGRWIQLRSGSGITADGEPATFENFRSYSDNVLLVTVVAWLLPKLISIMA